MTSAGSRRRHAAVLISVLCSLYLLASVRVQCFNSVGHEAIGMTAMSGLRDEHLYELKKILNGKDLVDLSKWGHYVSAHFAESEKMHFSLQSGDCKHIDFKCEDPNGLCLINSVKHFYEELIRQPGDERKGPPRLFQYPTNVAFTDSDNLKYLVSLMSDMHQPLRVGFAKDAGGRDIQVRHFGSGHSSKSCSLFDYLENEIINKMVEKYDNSWYGGWTHVNRIHHLHKADEELFERLGIDAVDHWARELAVGLCEDIYLNVFLERYLIPGDPNYTLDPSKDLDISFELEMLLEKRIRNNILRAGSRIAILLNHIFQHKKFTAFRRRSEFDKMQEQLSAQPQEVSSSSSAFLINACIILLVVLVLFYINAMISSTKGDRIQDTVIERELQQKCN